jgi:hypothetical protein
MIHTQSFFIAGLDDPQLAKESAFGAMTMFAVTFVLSILGIFYDNNFKKTGMEETEHEAEGYVLNTGEAMGYGTHA